MVRSRSPSLVLVTLLALGLSACTDDGVELLVDLRTDFVPGAEFFLVETRIEARGGGDAQRAMYGALQGAPAADGLRVAELAGIDRGAHVLTVTLRRANGEVLAERLVDLDLRGNFGVTVVMTRACAAVVCGEEESCVGGTCVSRSCTPETPESCPEPMCTTDDACTGGAAACSTGRCAAGACLSVETAGACGAGEFCQPEVGCLEYPELPDAGALDAGTLDGGELPIAPTIVRPARGTMVGSRLDFGNYSGSKPKLLWAGNGAFYEVEAIPCAASAIGTGGCDFTDTFRLTRFEETESFHFVELNVLLSLSSREEAVAWRVRGCQGSGGVGCGDWTESWFRVEDPADLDRDGRAEMIIGHRWRDEGGRPEGGVFVVPGATASTPFMLGNPLDALGGMGFAVTSGDLNGDGFAELVAGVPQHTDANTHRGRALVFRGADSFDASATSVTLDDAHDEGHQWFGASLAYLGDVDGDGYGDLAVGAPGAYPPFDETTTRMDPGEVYFYPGGPSFTTSPTTAMEILDPANDPQMVFGAAIVGCDMDSDGVLELVVGSPSTNPAKDGRVDVFRYASGLWTRIGQIAQPAWPEFGATLACSVDLDADGHNDLLVGAPSKGNGGMGGQGFVQVIFGDPTMSWTRRIQIEASDANELAHFGTSIVATDFDRDGVGEVVVGAPSFDLDVIDSGAVFLFRSSDRWTSMPGGFPITPDSPTRVGFGSCLAAPGWRSASNVVSLLVGAAGEQSTGFDGAFLTYERTDPGSGPVLDISLPRRVVERPITAPGPLFGWSCR